MKVLTAIAAALALSACVGPRYYPAYPAGDGGYYVAQTPARTVHYHTAYSSGLYLYGLDPWWEFSYYRPNFYPHHFSYWYPGWYPYHHPRGGHRHGPSPGRHPLPSPPVHGPGTPVPVAPGPGAHRGVSGQAPGRLRIHQVPGNSGRGADAAHRGGSYPRSPSPRAASGRGPVVSPPAPASPRMAAAPASRAAPVFSAPPVSSAGSTRSSGRRAPPRHEP